MGKRKADTGADLNGPPATRRKKSQLKWIESQWETVMEFKKGVERMKKKGTKGVFVVRKVFGVPEDSSDPEYHRRELTMLKLLPACNRIVSPILIRSTQKPEEHTLIFRNYALGDLWYWRRDRFTLWGLAVPEIHLWRILIQLSQALGVMQRLIGPKRKGRPVMLHCDIKPENILVEHNRTPYPNFKLHDFDLARPYSREYANESTFSGTAIWQPPENPWIKTRAADVWSMAACVGFLVNGAYPVDYDKANWMERLNPEELALAKKHRNEYLSEQLWFEAKAKRVFDPISPEYSANINYWLTQCLHFNPRRRPSVKRLMQQMVPEGEAILRKLGGDVAITDLQVTFDES